MTFLGLGPLEWLLVIAIAGLVVGIGQLPERRAQKVTRKKKARR